jgi:ferredoxin-NADP reductase
MIVSFHAGLSGTDVGSTWYQALSVALIAITSLAVVLRILAGSRESAVRGAADGKAAIHEPPSETVQRMVVVAVSPVADRVLGLRLVPLGGGTLPPWHPGAHITLRLANGLERQYSLCGDPAERNHYDIAVLRTEESAGGSEWIHANATVGMVLDVVGPLNHFELEAAFDYLFVAGGIGITPILAMIESLPQRRNWRLVYFGRSRTSMPFLGSLLERYPDRVFAIVGDENPVRPDVLPTIRASTAQVYCCGPESLMMSIADVVPVERMHLERFSPVVREAQPATAIEVNCTTSHKQFSVQPGESILDAMKANSVPVFASCLKGVCGSCETRVISGTPEHLDSVMDDAEKDSLGIMYPCVSRATSSTLVLEA